MKIFFILLVVILLISLAFVFFKTKSSSVACKNVDETYIIGKEKCCEGLDFAPTPDPKLNICLPKLPQGVAY